MATETPHGSTLIIRLRVEGMRCHSCEQKLGAWLRDIDGVTEVDASYEDSLVTIHANDGVEFEEMNHAQMHFTDLRQVVIDQAQPSFTIAGFDADFFIEFAAHAAFIEIFRVTIDEPDGDTGRRGQDCLRDYPHRRLRFLYRLLSNLPDLRHPGL